jgi:hypothetical protein
MLRLSASICVSSSWNFVLALPESTLLLKAVKSFVAAVKDLEGGCSSFGCSKHKLDFNDVCEAFMEHLMWLHL